MATANTSLIHLSAAPAASSKSPAESAPPPARADGPGPNRSFAATLARQQPKSLAGDDAAPAGLAGTAPADASSPPAVQSETDSAGKDARPAVKPAAKSKVANGGGSSPADGKALPLWLPPVIAAPAPAPTTTVAAVAAGGVNAPATAEAASAALKADEHASARVATAAQTEVSGAAAAAKPAATAEADVEPVGSTTHTPVEAAAAASTAELALTKALETPANGPTSSSAATASELAQKATAAADTAAQLQATAPVAEAAAKAAPAVTPAPAASVVTTFESKTARPPTVGVEALRNAAPAAEGTSAVPPLATDLKQAVGAVLSADTKGDAATTPTPKVTVDMTAGVLPQAATTATERASAPTVSQVSTPVGAPDWAHELSDRVSVLMNQNLTHAQIKLSPADLGPIEVRIALADGQANISFTTHSHVTTEALQAAAPRLREALGSQGYTSVNVDVAQQQFRERTPQQTRYEPESAFAASAPQSVTRAASRVASVASAALRLDAYA